VHFTRKALVGDALRHWSAGRLVRAMQQLAEASLDARRHGGLADAIARRALLALAVNARRNG
jgi:DNA polymerase-3 subunit delta